MRVPNAAHASRPWRIHEIVGDFRLEDVWALPTVDGPGEFARLVEVVASLDPQQSPSLAVRALVGARAAVGRLLGWDEPDTGIGSRVTTLRDRLPADLRDGPRGPTSAALPFRSLYLTEGEWAAELANKTVHGVLHLGAVPDDAGGLAVHMAVYVKPNGALGRAYMAAIKPFRHLLVYPSLMRAIERAWRAAEQGARA